MHLRTYFAAFIAVSIELAVAQNAQAQTEKPKGPALPPAIASYIAATSALAAGGEQAQLQMRTTQRMKLIRETLANLVLNTRPDEKIQLSYGQLAELICKSRQSYYKSRSNTELLVALNRPLTNLYTDPHADDSTWKRFILFVLPFLSRSEGSLPELTAATVEDVCKSDIGKFETEVYGLPAQTKFAPATIIGGMAGINAIYGIVEPVMKQVLAIAQDWKRRRAVLAFFGKEENRKKILAAVQDIQKSIVAENDANRFSALADSAEILAKISLSDLTKARTDACAAYIGPNAQPVPEGLNYPASFIACQGAIFGALKKDIEAFLLRAAAYDALADVAVAAKVSDKNTKDKFETMLKALGNRKADFKEVYSWVNSFVNLALEIEKATSKESRKKIKDAIDLALGRDEASDK